ncbi:MAG: thioesterase family protein [Acidimicrobiaceae bacterium]|nr:thioesterase family protein [Acidimicrobiaceae bacterium]
MSEHAQRLDRASAVTRDSRGRLVTVLHPDYTVFGVPNGGYLQCVIFQAVRAELGEGDVMAMSTNFVNAPKVGPADLEVEVVRRGRRVTFLRVRLSVEGRVATDSLVTWGSLEEGPARYQHSTSPELAPPEVCVSAPRIEGMTLHGALDLRVDPLAGPWWESPDPTRGYHETWMARRDGTAQWDALSLLFAADCLWPATVPLGSSGWVPTLQLTTYLRQRPRGAWLRARQRCEVVVGESVDERCELFDERGYLVADSQQIALVRFDDEVVRE